jgi:hypothetical protein
VRERVRRPGWMHAPTALQNPVWLVAGATRSRRIMGRDATGLAGHAVDLAQEQLVAQTGHAPRQMLGSGVAALRRFSDARHVRADEREGPKLALEPLGLRAVPLGEVELVHRAPLVRSLTQGPVVRGAARPRGEPLRRRVALVDGRDRGDLRPAGDRALATGWILSVTGGRSRRSASNSRQETSPRARRRTCRRCSR